MAFVLDFAADYFDGGVPAVVNEARRINAGLFVSTVGSPVATIGYDTVDPDGILFTGGNMPAGSKRALQVEPDIFGTSGLRVEYDGNGIATVWMQVKIKFIAPPTSTSVDYGFFARAATDAVTFDTFNKPTPGVVRDTVNTRWTIGLIKLNHADAPIPGNVAVVDGTIYWLKLRYIRGTLAQGGGGHLWVFNEDGTPFDEVDMPYDTTGTDNNPDCKVGWLDDNLDPSGFQWKLLQLLIWFNAGGGIGGDPAPGVLLRLTSLLPVGVDAADNWAATGAADLALATDDPGGADISDDADTTYAGNANATVPGTAKLTHATFDTAGVGSVLALCTRTLARRTGPQPVLEHGIDLAGTLDTKVHATIGAASYRGDFKIHDTKPGGGAWAVGDVANVLVVINKTAGGTVEARVSQLRELVVWIPQTAGGASVAIHHTSQQFMIVHG